MPQEGSQKSQSSEQRDLPDHFYNKDGEIDLRQVKGNEALAYLGRMGLHFPVIGS